jgi:hypothetical protein
MVVLYKASRQLESLEFVFAKRLHKKTTSILEDFRNQNYHVSKLPGFDFDFHPLFSL